MWNREVVLVSEQEYSLLSRVFTRAVLQEFSNKRTVDNVFFLRAVDEFISEPYTKTYANIFEILYDKLKKEYRNEYFYKNTLLNKLLLGVHSTNTTTALAELPIGKAKADFVLINGKAVVYEIKTELDNFERLDEQVANYYKAFDYVAVVTCEKNKEILLNKYVNSTVGIYIINKVGNISEIKKPRQNKENLDLGILFSLLRKKEYENILQKYYSILPDKWNFSYYDECQGLFCSLSVDEVYNDVLKQLKSRMHIVTSCFNNLPRSIKSLGYFENLSKKQYERLNRNLEKMYGR